METKTITAADALLLSTRQEDHFFDRKAAAIKGAKLQKIAVAFANADGGEAYVGIADEKDEPDPSKRWAGAPNIGACKNFCVNGHPAGNCHIARSDDDRRKESSTEGVAGQPVG
ncbi:RNA-binding domain-containing protein [Azonexus hydrophilus]|uniref:RNA-binding domain-containing protein n=1 Tax=Azonexus hydrophilus TaxID=418702 RepID=UPI0011156920|nr:RNA-binding domain-containing protein [Azonexus hydrophilus]